jgi:hypothetical protein
MEKKINCFIEIETYCNVSQTNRHVVSFASFPSIHKNGSRGKNLDFLKNSFPQCVENIVENLKVIEIAIHFLVGKPCEFSTVPIFPTQNQISFCFIFMQKKWKSFSIFQQIFSQKINRGKFSPKKSPNFPFPQAYFSRLSPSAKK